MKTLKTMAKVAMLGAVVGPSCLLEYCCHYFPGYKQAAAITAPAAQVPS